MDWEKCHPVPDFSPRSRAVCEHRASVRCESLWVSFNRLGKLLEREKEEPTKKKKPKHQQQTAEKLIWMEYHLASEVLKASLWCGKSPFEELC